MEVDLNREPVRVPPTLPGYRFLAWSYRLVAAHAEAKYLSFRNEIDAQVFPCLGDYSGCHRLMREISRRKGFLPQATWLVVHEATGDVCGTIQGVRADASLGSIQNVGVVPEHRRRGLGAGLLARTLHGFQLAGLGRAYLEVTSENQRAIELYRQFGFEEAETVYKVAEIAYT